jgi:hypothetical protein
VLVGCGYIFCSISLGPLSGGTLVFLLGIPYAFWCMAILFVLVSGWPLFAIKIENSKAPQTVE